MLSLSEAVYSQSWEHMHEWYAAFVVVAGGLNLDLAPQLQAVDAWITRRRARDYERLPDTHAAMVTIAATIQMTGRIAKTARDNLNSQ